MTLFGAIRIKVRPLGSLLLTIGSTLQSPSIQVGHKLVVADKHHREYALVLAGWTICNPDGGQTAAGFVADNDAHAREITLGD